MSIWKPDPEVYLKRLQSEKLHNGAINKILHAQLSDNLNYIQFISGLFISLLSSKEKAFSSLIIKLFNFL